MIVSGWLSEIIWLLSFDPKKCSIQSTNISYYFYIYYNNKMYYNVFDLPITDNGNCKQHI